MAETAAIAIVGAGCRYPDAADPERLWEMVLARRRPFRPIPRVRLDMDDYRGPGPDSTYARLAAVLDGWRFDRSRYRIPGATYRVADLTHWLALDVAAQTLASAGFPDAIGLDRDRVAVVMGNTLTGEFSRAFLMRLRWPYARRALADAMVAEGLDPTVGARLLATFERGYKAPFPEPTDESLSGGLANVIAGRICNYFGLHGGGYTVDGACASSLLAIITACQTLLHGDVDLVLAGGVDLSLDPMELVGFARLGAISGGDMRVYDAEPTGFVPGEGCGMVALMRERDAAAAQLAPWAVIRGWGVSSDGRGGITRPELSGQLLALRRAYRQAGFGPETVALFEGHGTGTAVGDQVEIEALIHAQDGKPRAVPAALGSIKANIGHTKAAAGVAGLIKATLALRHQVIPPTTGCTNPHALLVKPDSPVQVTGVRTWPDGPLRAGVSAMGFGGINTHVVLEAEPPRRRRALTARTRVLSAPPLSHEVFACGAPSARQLAATLTRIADVAPAMSFADHADLAAALADSQARRPQPYRVAMVSRDPAQLARQAQQALSLVSGLGQARESALLAHTGIFVGQGGPGGVGLLFSGQGAPVPSGPGTLGQVFPEAGEYFPLPRADEPGLDTARAQPAILRASLAGLRWLDRLGAQANAAAGHSMGEIAALCWAGALTEATALQLVTARGRIMSELGARDTGMASVSADPAVVSDLITGTGLVIAADNGAAQVIAGSFADLDSVSARAGRRGIAVHRLSVSHAFHSPAVAAARPALAARLARLPVGRLAKTVYSTVYGRPLTTDDDLRLLLAEQVTAPVLFRQALLDLAAECAILVEVGPGHGLAALAAGVTAVPAVALDVGAASAEGVCTVAAALFAAGAVPGLRPLFGHRFRRSFDLWRDFEFLANPCEQVPAARSAALILNAEPQAAERPSARPEAGVAPAADHPGTAPDVPQAVIQDPTGPAGVADRVRRLVADAVELPPQEIRPADRLLSDLHLNSLLVGQLAARAALECGRAVPAAPLSLADAAVADLVAVIEALPLAEELDLAAVPPGVADWHHVLIAETGPADRGWPEPEPRCWRIEGVSPLRGPVERLLPAGPQALPAALVFLPEDPDDVAVGLLVAAARRAVTEGVPLVVIDQGETASGFLATICQEHPDVAVRLVRVAPILGHATAAVARTAAAAAIPSGPGFSEVVVDQTGQARPAGYRPLDLPEVAQLPLGHEDVVLVTGGGKGIGFETALALSLRTGAQLGLLGRADPGSDGELSANLGRLAAAGVIFRYERADVCDPAAVRTAVSGIAAALGPITALIHASGINHPARFDALSDQNYADHAAPKYYGLRVVTDAIDHERLRIVLTYGSVIGRFGLAGEAHYALANGRMRELVRVLAANLPGCWVCNIDWTVWSGAGMGDRLDVLDQLVRAGVSPLPLGPGVELLFRLLAARPATPSVVVTGRLPQLDQASVLQPPAGYRFAQRIIAFTPGVELVTEVGLSLQEDPYLADHRIDGMAVLPAVCALEAMAQAAAVLAGRPVRSITQGRFDMPVTVPDNGARTVRICALRRDAEHIEVVLRSEETSFSVDHFSGQVAPAVGPPQVREQRTALPEHLATQLYGPLFFHGPAFQLLRRYEHLEATACTAVLAGAGAHGNGHAGVLQLGDPARNDASIHVLQACVPHRRLLPVGCDRFTVHGDPGDSAGPRAPHELTLAATQRAHNGSDYTYDVVMRDAAGLAILSWTGLRLRDVGPIDISARWRPLLLGPYLQHSATALLRAAGLQIQVRPGGARTEDRISARSVQTTTAGTIAQSRSHLDGVVLEASAPAPVACDWEPVVDHDQIAGLGRIVPWADQAKLLGRLTGEPEEHILTRLWTAQECLSKTGRTAAGPLVVQGVYEEGWVLLRAGADSIASSVLYLHGEPRPVAVAILARETPCEPISSTGTS
jgi:enediyne polyketide synthase